MKSFLIHNPCVQHTPHDIIDGNRVLFFLFSVKQKSVCFRVVAFAAMAVAMATDAASFDLRSNPYSITRSTRFRRRRVGGKLCGDANL